MGLKRLQRSHTSSCSFIVSLRIRFIHFPCLASFRSFQPAKAYLRINSKEQQNVRRRCKICQGHPAGSGQALSGPGPAGPPLVPPERPGGLAALCRRLRDRAGVRDQTGTGRGGQRRHRHHPDQRQPLHPGLAAGAGPRGRETMVSQDGDHPGPVREDGVPAPGDRIRPDQIQFQQRGPGHQAAQGHQADGGGPGGIAPGLFNHKRHRRHKLKYNHSRY